MAADLTARIAVIGAGCAGLVTAQTLLQDGFTDVEVLTRDPSPGGVWCADRIYPGLFINNVHGEFRFSSLELPPSRDAKAGGGRLSGQDMRLYMEEFSKRFLKGRIRYRTEVLNIKPLPKVPCDESGSRTWFVTVKDLTTHQRRTLEYDKIVLCTGACSQARVPPGLSQEDAAAHGFLGPVIHSSEFGPRREDILRAVKPASESPEDIVLVVGGGKSAQDIAAYLTREGRRVCMVFTVADATFAAPIPYPDFVRRSRLLSVFSPHIELRTRLEKFMHTSWIGSKIVQATWKLLSWMSFTTLGVPRNSPLRRTRSLFWTLRTNDEGIGLPDGFYDLMRRGKIELIAPARAVSIANDGQGVVLHDKRVIRATAIINATGHASTWDKILDQETIEALGLNKQYTAHTSAEDAHEWDGYITLSDPPPACAEQDQWTMSIYRGIVPLKCLFDRDFAINGGTLTTNNGYVFEVCAHWIASYFRQDPFLRLPKSKEDGRACVERNAAWLRKRYPDAGTFVNESNATDLAFWSWPRLADTLLDDMRVPSARSGGNALTWLFRTIELKEIERLGEERAQLRAQSRDLAVVEA